MADKISKELTMAERLTLLSRLPKEGDILTFKILRKLRETLAPNEDEIKEYNFISVFRCPHVEYESRGKRVQCEVEQEAEMAPTCPIHSQIMARTGKVPMTPVMFTKTKQIFFGPKANDIIVETLSKISENDKKIDSDIIFSLYEKFIGVETE